MSHSARLHIRLPPDVEAKAKALSLRRGIPLSVLIREILEMMVEEDEKANRALPVDEVPQV